MIRCPGPSRAAARTSCRPWTSAHRDRFRPGLLRGRDLDRRQGLRQLPGQALRVPADVFDQVQAAASSSSSARTSAREQPRPERARHQPRELARRTPRTRARRRSAARHDARVLRGRPRSAARRRRRPAQASGQARPQPAAAPAAAEGAQQPRAASRSRTRSRRRKVDIWTGKDDKTLRRLELDARVRPPRGAQGAGTGRRGRRRGARARGRRRQREAGDQGAREPAALERAPAAARELGAGQRPRRLVRQRLLRRIGGSGSSGSGSGGSGSKRTQKYLECVQKAKTPEDVQALRRRFSAASH